MLRVTKKAHMVLNAELANYETYLVNRATVYAEQDESIEIKAQHIKKAIKDYRNDYYFVSSEKNKNKARRKSQLLMLFFTLICLAFYLLIIFLFVKGDTLTNTVEVISLLGALTTMMLVMTMYASMIRRRKVEKETDNREKIIVFLNKWNEFESLLKTLYKKKNNTAPKTFRDLLMFYQQHPSIVNSGNPESLHRLLNSRNNLLHRTIKEVNSKTIDGLIGDMDEIIETLKKIE